MSRIKYGQIGVGHAHAGKMSVYRDSGDYEGGRRRRAGRDAAQTGPTVERLQRLKLDDRRAVAESAGTAGRRRGDPRPDLLDTAEKCVEAGMHVHIDKPAGDSYRQFQRILDEAARKHLTVQMGYMYRYNPAIVRMREFLQNGWLGEPFEVHAVMSKLVGASARARLAEYSGGAMFELGCHLIDLVVGALGAPDEVHAFPRHSADAGDGLLDNMLAVFEYPAATAAVRSSVTEVEGFARRHFVLCGTEGTMHIQPLDSPKARVAFRTQHGKYSSGYQDVEFPRYVRYVDDAADLAKIVRHEKEADFSYEHDLAVQRCVLEASGLSIDS